VSTSPPEFLEYVRPCWRRLHLTARQYVRAEDAADLVQEVLLRCWRSFAQADERPRQEAWLFAALRNVAFEWRRTEKRRVKLVPMPEVELTELAPADLSAPLSPLPAMAEQEFRELLDDRIVQALDALEPAYREVVVLSVAGDLNYREIAEALDCPIGTVMSRMARARRALRERLADLAVMRDHRQGGCST